MKEWNSDSSSVNLFFRLRFSLLFELICHGKSNHVFNGVDSINRRNEKVSRRTWMCNLISSKLASASHTHMNASASKGEILQIVPETQELFVPLVLFFCTDEILSLQRLKQKKKSRKRRRKMEWTKHTLSTNEACNEQNDICLDAKTEKERTSEGWNAVQMLEQHR